MAEPVKQVSVPACLVRSAVFMLGVFAFSSWRIDWYRHVLIPGGTHIRPAVVWPLLLLVAVWLAIRRADATGRRDRGSGSIPARGLISHGGVVRLATFACALFALYQLAAPSNSVWLLYAWVLSAACMLAATWAPAGWPIVGHRLAVALLVALIALLTFLHVRMQLDAWRLMSFGYHDIGHFARALHSAVNGRGLWVDSLNRSLLGEHAFFLLLVLVPVCKLGADPFLTLVIVSPLLMNGPALVVYWFARKKAATPLNALLLALAWLLLPMHGCLVLSGGAGFHEAQMAVPLLLAGLAAGELRRFRLAAALMAVALLAREDIALTVAAWGLYLAVFKRSVRLGGTVFLAAAAYFGLMLYVVIPAFRGAPYPHVAFNIGQQITTPLETLHRQLSFLATLTVPLALLCFRQWRMALVAVPALAETLLTHNPDFHNIVFHYYIAAIPPLFIAAAGACLADRAAPAADESSEPPPCATASSSAAPPAPLAPSQTPPCATASSSAASSAQDGRPRAVILTGLLVTSAYLGQSYWGTGDWTHNPIGIACDRRLADSYPQIVALRGKIGRHRSVVASTRIAAHFMDADRIWRTGDGFLGDAIVIHDTDMNLGTTPREVLTQAMKTGEYQPIYADNHLVAVLRNAGPLSIASELVSARNDLADSIDPVDMGDGIRLVGLQVTRRDEDAARFTLIWQGDGTAKRDYRFGLSAGTARWGPFHFARGAYPPPTWDPRSYYRDELIVDRRAADAWHRGQLTVLLLE